MFLSKLHKGRAFLLGTSLAFAVLVVWLARGLMEEPRAVREILPPGKTALVGAGQSAFPMRKAPSPLDEVLKRGGAFASRFDGRRGPTRQAARPGRTVRRTRARPVALRPKGPGYNWGNVRLMGVVLVKENTPPAAVRQTAPSLVPLRPEIAAANYAIFEFGRAREQVVLTEGERLKGGAVLLRVESDRAILEFQGEIKVFKVSPKPLGKKTQPPGRVPPAIANAPR